MGVRAAGVDGLSDDPLPCAAFGGEVDGVQGEGELSSAFEADVVEDGGDAELIETRTSRSWSGVVWRERAGGDGEHLEGGWKSTVLSGYHADRVGCGGGG